MKIAFALIVANLGDMRQENSEDLDYPRDNRLRKHNLSQPYHGEKPQLPAYGGAS